MSKTELNPFVKSIKKLSSNKAAYIFCAEAFTLSPAASQDSA
jgi:hypothetical protein